jgi:hypothetical protein
MSNNCFALFDFAISTLRGKTFGKNNLARQIAQIAVEKSAGKKQQFKSKNRLKSIWFCLGRR